MSIQMIFRHKEVKNIKPIKDFDHYYIEKNGDVYSDQQGELRKIKPWIDHKGLYLQIGLSKNGKRYKKLVHRLVAEAYIPNPKKLPEVNHKDKNTKNPNVENLEWCTRKENLHQSYETMSPVRNYKKCSLYYHGEFVSDFESIVAAVRYAVDNYGCKKTMIHKYKEHNGCKIICRM